MLEVENLHAGYGEGSVLHGISFSLRAGEIVSLLGRNGAGKSTTLLTLMGYLKPDPGRIVFHGQNISGLRPHHVARLGFGFVPQERRIFPSLTVGENLTFAARAASPDCGRTRWDLPRVYALFPRLQERKRNFGAQLSGGEQQMLAIARALMLNPAILLLDEPSEGLAPMIVQEIITVVAGLRRQGLAVLLVEQNLSTAFALADRHHVMNKGRIHLTATTAEIAHNEAVLKSYLGV
jgi:branched-chain amino acid transport system ATP-binding protein